MRILVRFFAIFREQAGVSSVELELHDGMRVGQAVETISATYHLSGMTNAAPRRIAYAVNHEYCSAGTVLHDGDELALIPPVSGG